MAARRQGAGLLRHRKRKEYYRPLLENKNKTLKDVIFSIVWYEYIDSRKEWVDKNSNPLELTFFKSTVLDYISSKTKEEIKTIKSEDPGSKRSASPKRRKYKRKKRGEERAPVEKTRVKMIKVRVVISKEDLVFTETAPAFVMMNLAAK